MSKQLGYILVDHRASPGLPENVARWAGYDPKSCGEGKLFESSIALCPHCNNTGMLIPPRTRERAKCFECDNKEGRYICDACDYIRRQPGYTHAPFTKFIDDTLAVAANPCSTRELPSAPGTVISGSPTKLLFPTE